MVAFAANSLLNRLALLDGAIGPAEFAAIRVSSGVVVLVLLLIIRDRNLPKPLPPRWAAVGGLAVYMLGFSFAYVSMDAGLGALILFGIVQITMFGGALIEGETAPAQRWAGMILAMAGLALLTYPSGAVKLEITALMLMVGAGIGWGIYSLIGRRVAEPVSATAWNFIYCLPVVLIVLLLVSDGPELTSRGVILATLSGGVTSALGYALWYALLPQLGATRGALAQLSAPAIALFLGAILLRETVTLTAMLAATLILGGIAIGLVRR